MIPLERFLQGIRTIRAAKPTYRLGGSGVDGTCDCIGLIIGAIRRAGGEWKGTHGSNYAARSEMTGGLRRVTAAGQLEVGEAVYKARSPGAAGYDLPAKYQSSGDLLDYYHVGVVTGVAPLEITHCTGPGVIVDTKLGKWGWAGRLKKIEYEGGSAMQEETGQKAVVVAASGSTVNLRGTPYKGGVILAKVPVGTAVDVLEVGSEWCTVTALGKRGYMMRQFLSLEWGEKGPDDVDKQQVPAQDTAAFLARFEAIEARLAALEGGGAM